MAGRCQDLLRGNASGELESKKAGSSPDFTSKAHVISGLPIRSTSILGKERKTDRPRPSIRGRAAARVYRPFPISGSWVLHVYADHVSRQGWWRWRVKRKKQFNSRVASRRVQLITITRVRTAKSLKRDNTTQRRPPGCFRLPATQACAVRRGPSPFPRYVKQCPPASVPRLLFPPPKALTQSMFPPSSGSIALSGRCGL